MSNNNKTSLFSQLKSKHYKTEDNTEKAGSALADDLQQLVRRINKKSEKTVQTRIKTFQELKQLISLKDLEQVKTFIKVFVVMAEQIIFAEKEQQILIQVIDILDIINNMD